MLVFVLAAFQDVFKEQQIDPNTLLTIKKDIIGRGTSCTVRRCLWKNPEEDNLSKFVAVKCIDNFCSFQDVKSQLKQ